jgi:RimJ/RimL family protein N-acetyltransferase
MEIESKRLLLKEITWDDLEAIHHIHSFPEVDEFNTLGIPKDLDETREVIRKGIEDKDDPQRGAIHWKIILKETNAIIGLAGMFLSRDKFRLGEIYYKLIPGHWGKGYATEVSKALIKSGFKVLDLHKVEAEVASGNIRSIRVLEKSGMTREGLRRKILPIRGEWKDAYLFAIVEDDPKDY